MSDAADAASPSPDNAAQHLARTERGRSVLQDRSLPLSRAARNLLLVIEPGHTAGHWLAQVRGATPADLQQLVDEGLVAAPAAPPPPAAPVAAAPTPRIPLTQALERLDFKQISERLTALARPQLGLIKGFRMVLAIERATDAPALRTLALQMVEQVRLADGDEAAQRLAQLLADGPRAG